MEWWGKLVADDEHKAVCTKTIDHRLCATSGSARTDGRVAHWDTASHPLWLLHTRLRLGQASTGVTVRCGPVGRLAVAARRRRSLWRWRRWSARVGTAQAELSAEKEGQSVHFLRDSELSGVNVFQLPNLWLYSRPSEFMLVTQHYLVEYR